MKDPNRLIKTHRVIKRLFLTVLALLFAMPCMANDDQLLKIEEHGSIRIARMMHYKKIPIPPRKNFKNRKFVETKIEYPQIIEPSNIGQMAWNEHILEKYIVRTERMCEGRPAEYSLKYEISFFAEQIISTEVNSYVYCVGAPHGYDLATVNRTIF